MPPPCLARFSLLHSPQVTSPPRSPHSDKLRPIEEASLAAAWEDKRRMEEENTVLQGTFASVDFKFVMINNNHVLKVPLTS